MAINDVVIVDSSGYAQVPVLALRRDDRTTSSDTVCFAGEPVKLNGGESGNDVIHLATGDPEGGTDIVMGITAAGSTETSTVDGVVDVYAPLPGIVYRTNATTPANLANGVLYDCVTFDLTSTTYTIDENEGSDENVHGCRIIDFNATDGTVDWEWKDYVTRYGASV